MCGGVEELGLKQQKQEEIKIDIREQLTSVQSWDGMGTEETVAQKRTAYGARLIQQEKEENADLVAHVMESYTISDAGAAAEGTPQAPMVSAKKSWKQRQEEAKRTKEVRKVTSAGDYGSYKILQSIQRSRKERDNSCTEEILKQAKQADVDERVLRSFVGGYRVNTRNKEQQRRKEEDREFLEDYISKDVQRRWKHLDRITQEMLAAEVTEEMLDPAYLESNSEEVIRLNDRMTYFQNIMNDPVNQPFFDQLPQLERNLLQAKYGSDGGSMATLLVNRLAMKGIALQEGKFYEDETKVKNGVSVRKPAAQIKMAKKSDEVYLEVFRKERKALQEREDAVYQQALQQELDQARQLLVGEYLTDAAQVEELGFGFTTQYMSVYSIPEMENIRNLIESAPETFAAHQDALKKLYQQLYRQYDALNALQLEHDAAQEVAQANFAAEGRIARVAQMACDKAEDLHIDLEMLHKQVNGTVEAIRFYVQGKKLSERARKELERVGLPEEAEQLRQQRMTPQERLQERLNHLTFSGKTQADSGLTLNTWFNQNYRATIAEVTEETGRKGLFEEFAERFSNKEKYGDAYSGSIETGSFSNVDGTVVAKSLVSARMAPQLVGVLAKGETTESMARMYDKLLCTGRYRYLKAREGKQTPEGAPLLSEAEATELAGYTEEKLQELDATFGEGMLQLKELQYRQLCRLRDKYGRMGSQMHPEDFIAKIGPEFFDETAFVQDLQQMMQAGEGKYFDFNTPEDQEYRVLANYYNAVFCIMRGYMLTDISGDTEQFTPNPDMMELSFKGLGELTEAGALETLVHGPGLSEAEQELYREMLQQRFGGEQSYRLYGRFAPGADEPAAEAVQEAPQETIVEEVREEVLEAVLEETTMEEATVETLLHEAVLEEVQDTRTAEQRVEERMRTLSFTPAPERTAGLSTKEFYFQNDRKHAGLTTLETGRETLPEDFKKRFSDPKYGEGYGSTFKNMEGVEIKGLQSTRLTSLLVGSLGHGHSAEELAALYEKLLSCARYNHLKLKEEKQTIEPEEAAELESLEAQKETLNATFHEGVLELKEMQKQQLERLVEKYGRFGGQLHPEDFLTKVGPEYFDDTGLLQDVGDMIDYLHAIGIQDERFEQLGAYFSAVYKTVDQFMTTKYKDGSKESMEDYENMDSHRSLRDLDQVIGGDGFSAEEQAAYEEQVRQRVQTGEPVELFGRFKSQEMREAEARAKAQADAEAEAALLATAHIRTRKEAINTPSDQRSESKRMVARGLALRCKRDTPLRIALEDYYGGSRYAVGYTEERRRLKVAISEMEKAWNALTKEEQQDESNATAKTLRDIRAYFAEVTNGTLQVPEGAQVQDFSDQRPAEQGTLQRGSKRNALIRGFSYWSDQKDTPLFSHEPTVNDLKQRMVSNCYMVAGTAGLVNLDPALLKECIRDNLDGTVTVRLFEKYTPEEEAQKEAESRAEIQRELEALQEKVDAGEVEEWDVDSLELEINAKQYQAKQSYRPVYVKVSKEIPRIVGGADALSAGALWMQMIEKACAFVGRDGVKGYKSLWYGEGGGFLERLLGVEPEQVGTSDADQLFNDICSCHQNRTVYNAGTGGGVGEADGLNTGHAYTVMGGKTVGSKRFVLLRNPYSTMSLQYQEDGQTTRTGRHLDTHSDPTYGQFYMEFEEFLQKFQKITRTDLSKAQRNPGAS